MTNIHTTHQFDPGEDDFFDFTDRMTDGDPMASNHLEATALRVQHALRVPQPQPQSLAMPRHLKHTLWKDIMNTTSYDPPVAAPWRRPFGPRGSTGRYTELRQFPRMAWTGAANIALALLVIVALLGAWRGLQNPNSPTQPATLPVWSMQGSTPASGISDASGTPAAISACDMSGDIPIITDLTSDDLPFSGTVLYVVQPDVQGVDPRGILKLGCEGAEPVVLAEDVTSVSAGPWPGILNVYILPVGEADPAKAMRGYVRIDTGALFTFAAVPMDSRWSLPVIEGSPWVIGPSTGDPSTLEIADLRTMESRPLSDVIGTEIPIDMLLITSSPADNGSVVIGVAHPYSASIEGGTLQGENLVVLGDSFSDVTNVTVPDSLPRVSGISLSPDGTHAAITSMGDGEMMSESYRYGLINLTNGTVIGQSGDIPYMDSPFVTWLQDGLAIAYLADTRMETLLVDGNGEPVVAFEAESQLFHLQTTWSPDVMVAATHRDHGSDATQGQTYRDVVYSVNFVTGTVHEFAGLDASATIGWISETGALVMYQWEESNPETTNYTVFDPVTGDQIGEIADAPTVQVGERTRPTLGVSSIAVSADGSVEVIALGTQYIYAFSASNDGLTMTRIPSPEGMLSEQFLTANVFLSPDGTLLSLNGEEDEGRTRYLISLEEPDAEWAGFTNNVVGERGRGLISFVASGLD